MNIIVALGTIVVTSCLWLLTLRGAHTLTGRLEITLILGALVLLQWVAARRAIDALSGTGAPWLWRLGKLGFQTLLWLSAASVTVSLVGGELYGMFSAREAATTRFGAEQTNLRQRARQLGQAFNQTLTLSEQYAAHAQSMAAQEETRGHSCAINLGIGPGEIRNFRRTDANSANGLVAQLRPQALAAASLVSGIDAMRFSSAVPELRLQLGHAVDDLNGLVQSPVWAQVLTFVESSQKAAGDIRVGTARFTCDDRARTLLLDQMFASATATKALVALVPGQLLDPLDDKSISQATVLRTWAGVLGWLPKSWWGGRPLLDARVQQQYAVEDQGAVLNAGNMPLIWAWLLELILVGLMTQVGNPQRLRTTPTLAQRLWVLAIDSQSQKSGLLGQVARAFGSPAPHQPLYKTPYFNAHILFADEAMEERACTVAPWYRPWGARDMLAIPLSSTVAARAARELWHARLLRRVGSSLTTAELMRNAQLARAMHTHARAESALETAWDVYQVTNPHFLRWLLAQPVEARGVLAA